MGQTRSGRLAPLELGLSKFPHFSKGKGSEGQGDQWAQVLGRFSRIWINPQIFSALSGRALCAVWVSRCYSNTNN